MSGYEPLGTLKPVDDNIWIADGAPIGFYGIPFTTRMTVVRLGSGELFIHSPIKPAPGLLDEVQALGPVRHLVSPNWIHYAFIPHWTAIFPKAITWASPNVRERAAKNGIRIRFDRDLGEEAPADWSADMSQLMAHGSRLHTEVAFFHHVSRTLILTDLIENFEAKKLPLWLRPLARIAGILDPDGKAPMDMRASFSGGKKKLRAAVEQMIAWGPERIILAHGRWYEKNGVEELKRAFRWVLK